MALIDQTKKTYSVRIEELESKTEAKEIYIIYLDNCE